MSQGRSTGRMSTKALHATYPIAHAHVLVREPAAGHRLRSVLVRGLREYGVDMMLLRLAGTESLKKAADTFESIRMGKTVL